jgi:hypothetical protein
MARIYLDRSKSRSTCTIQQVIVDEVEITNGQGQSGKSLSRQIVCETGRVLGSGRLYAHAAVNAASNLTASECRALAEALQVAADVLEGKQEAEEITRQREQYEEQVRQLKSTIHA